MVALSLPWLVVIGIEGVDVEPFDSLHAAARCSMIPSLPDTVLTKHQTRGKQQGPEHASTTVCHSSFSSLPLFF